MQPRDIALSLESWKCSDWRVLFVAHILRAICAPRYNNAIDSIEHGTEVSARWLVDYAVDFDLLLVLPPRSAIVAAFFLGTSIDAKAREGGLDR